MKCDKCSYEISEPEWIGTTSLLTCTNCGHASEVRPDQLYTKEQIIKVIAAAFSGVGLGDGIGLFEAKAIDNYEPEQFRNSRREQDEKLDWKKIPAAALANHHSSLSFFDADGMRFHLAAFMIASLRGEVEDPIFHLTLSGQLEQKFSTLNTEQVKAVIAYLRWCLSQSEYEYDHDCIEFALASYWMKRLL